MGDVVIMYTEFSLQGTNIKAQQSSSWTYLQKSPSKITQTILLFWFLHMVPTHLNNNNNNNIIIIIIFRIFFGFDSCIWYLPIYYLYLYFPIYKTWCKEYNIKHIKWRERHISPPECAGQFVKDVFSFFSFFSFFLVFWGCAVIRNCTKPMTGIREVLSVGDHGSQISSTWFWYIIAVFFFFF